MIRIYFYGIFLLSVPLNEILLNLTLCNNVWYSLTQYVAFLFHIHFCKEKHLDERQCKHEWYALIGRIAFIELHMFLITSYKSYYAYIIFSEGYMMGMGMVFITPHFYIRPSHLFFVEKLYLHNHDSHIIFG